MTSVQSRVDREKEAYNENQVWLNSHRFHMRFLHVFICPNALHLDRYFNNQVARYAPGAAVLDYGCNQGDLTEMILSCQPASLVGIDISDNAIAIANEKYGSRANFYVRDAHNTAFPDHSFDLIVGASVLHHLNLDLAMTELRRILKPGGVLIFNEPLRDNPAARFIRLLTPHTRTKDEDPLSRRQIQRIDQSFASNEHQFGGLTSVPVAMLTSKFLKSADNFLLQRTHQIDLLFAKTPLKYWMRRVILVWKSAG